ncbi:MAG TPA: cytochrome P450, partial [Acidimicrobiia bacterium]|nr:cytochrome P450 [Acidimicrobiia bacterium]
MTTFVTGSGLAMTEPDFWRRPLNNRMADFAVLREQGAFIPNEVGADLFGEAAKFYAVIRHAEVNEISRKPQLFCSGKGSTAIQDLPIE